MSVRVMSWVWEHSRAVSTQRFVLLAIADCANDAGAEAYPSMATLVKKTRLGERTVQEAIKKLAALGELVVSWNAGPRGCNKYRIVMKTPAAAAPPQLPHPASPAPPPPREPHPSPAGAAPLPPQQPHPNHPLTILEPSFEPSPSGALFEPPAKPPRKTATKTADDPAFDAFWSAYPRKADKGHARKAWATAIKGGADPAAIAAAAEAHAAGWTRNRTEVRFIPHAATWLNGERWGDAPERASPAANGHRPFRNPTDPSAYEGEL